MAYLVTLPPQLQGFIKVHNAIIYQQADNKKEEGYLCKAARQPSSAATL